ncbi:MAG: hypothetical protein COV63_00780 [Candidatus Nealsonbacteria bacterium CG11_big_fil_rev_8_21_14_0_20_37_68]|nr:MAG: hypothetical protein COV63_00780 [Candidatus Nealsonbacteria bacterium CG11_big_fil_rev_8_21_14_0_20_37_68]
MKNERIFCFGRPIIDITASINDEFLKEVNINENLQGKIPKKKMEKLLKQLSKKADYLFVSAGGVEVNVAINSAILGIPSTIVGVIGDDYFHLMFKDSLGFIKKLDLSLISVAALNSAAIAVIWIVKDSGEKKRIKVFNYGASEYLLWNTSIEDGLKSTTIFFSSLFTTNTSQIEPIWRNAIRTAGKFGKKVIISLGGIDTVPKRKLGRVMDIIKEYADIVFMNEKEHDFVQNYYHKEISSIFLKAELIVITRGWKGHILLKKEGGIYISSFPGEALEPSEQIFDIGAGDAFCAGFIFALSRGVNPEEAGKFASEVSLIKIRCPESHLTKGSLVELKNLKLTNS